MANDVALPEKEKKGFFRRIFDHEVFKTQMVRKPLLYGFSTLLGVYFTVFGLTSNNRKAMKYSYLAFVGVTFSSTFVYIYRDAVERAKTKELFTVDTTKIKQRKPWWETEDEEEEA